MHVWVFWDFCFCKVENCSAVVSLREVFLLTRRWTVFPEALCICWLLFQTISTSLIIIISHFYAWIPRSSPPPDCYWLISTLANKGMDKALHLQRQTTFTFFWKGNGWIELADFFHSSFDKNNKLFAWCCVNICSPGGSRVLWNESMTCGDVNGFNCRPLVGFCSIQTETAETPLRFETSLYWSRLCFV